MEVVGVGVAKFSRVDKRKVLKSHSIIKFSSSPINQEKFNWIFIWNKKSISIGKQLCIWTRTSGSFSYSTYGNLGNTSVNRKIQREKWYRKFWNSSFIKLFEPITTCTQSLKYWFFDPEIRLSQTGFRKCYLRIRELLGTTNEIWSRPTTV